jgi:hypothetical protein
MDNYFILTECLISLVIMAYIWFFPLNRLRRDNFRSDIRRIRDELFDFMFENKYDFSIPAYIQTRQTLNGILRLSNNLSVLSFFINIIFIAKRISLEYDPNISIDKIQDEQLKKKLTDVLSSAVIRILKFTFMEGTPKIFTMFVFYIFKLLKRLSDLQKWGKDTGSKFLSEAYKLGSPTLSEDQKAFLHS